MTWLEIYNKVVLKIWGTSIPAQGVQDALQGTYGIISSAHRKIQEDKNYWFMEQDVVTTLTSGIGEYALPDRFKEVVQNGFRLIDVTSSNRHYPLLPLLPGDAYKYFRTSTDTADYPTYYEIYSGALRLYPIPSLTGVTLEAKVYKYLERPPAVFGATYDTLTREGYNAIAAMASAEMCRILEEYQKAQAFEAEAASEIENLKIKDTSMRRAEINQCVYSGI